MRPDWETKRPLRVFITGVSGLLGLNAALQLKDYYEVSGAYLSHPVRVDGVRMFQLDLADESAVREALVELAPEVVLHTAGLTNVDACQANPREAERLHVDVTNHVARAARGVGAKLVHISTDHLSGGKRALVTEVEGPEPVNEYARTKWKAERVAAGICPDALIIRTNFFGWGTPVKKSFSDWVLEGLKSGKAVGLFRDVHISPILIADLVRVIEQLFLRKASGIFNVGSHDPVSKYEFGVQAATVFGLSDRGLLKPVQLRDVSLLAPRPLDMSLSTAKVEDLLGEQMPSVADGLLRLRELGEQDWPGLLTQAMNIEAGKALHQY